MRIGIIGAGMIGSTLGTLWLRSGHQIRYGTRHPEQVRVSGAGSDTVRAAAEWAETIVLAVPLGATAVVAEQAARATSGKVLLDTGNPYPQREPNEAAAIAASGAGSGVWVASHFPGARVVKAFNTVYFQTLLQRSGHGDDPLGIPLASDDAQALEVAERLVRDAGFESVVFGTLSEARRFEVGSAVWNIGSSAAALRRFLANAK
jgi:predicted dinucleotide-binding enzyme